MGDLCSKSKERKPNFAHRQPEVSVGWQGEQVFQDGKTGCRKALEGEAGRDDVLSMCVDGGSGVDERRQRRCEDEQHKQTHIVDRIHYYRQLFGYGYHPTANRALILLRISKYLSRFDTTANNYDLCDFMTEHVLSFCVDTTLVLIVDAETHFFDITRSNAPTCLVVDEGPNSTRVTTTVRTRTNPPQHFIFASMCYRRAV
eukprot:PhM_4_TR3397/c4_g2_i1/m.64523